MSRTATARSGDGVPDGVTRLPDTEAWVNRFEVKSESSDRVYIIAQSKSGRWWKCGCHGCIRHGSCKHLKACGLPGNYQPFEPKREDETMAKKSFAEIDAARKRYDPAKDGYGDPAEWTKKFGARMGYEEAASVIRATSESPRKIMHLGAITDWPEVRAAYRVLMSRIPETDVEGRRRINAAYSVLARELGH